MSDVFKLNLFLQTGVCFEKCAQEPLQFYWFRSAVKFWNRMVNLNSNTLRDIMKADISFGDSGASNCWTRQMKDVFCRIYRSD